jgi:hypothetical protein
MGETDKYDLEEAAVGTGGWNAIMTSNMQKVDSHMHTRILVLLGEAVTGYEALYQNPADSKWYKAQADGTKQPARCFAVEAGSADQTIRGQRIGRLTNTGVWSFTPGKNVYLSDISAGGVTQARRGGSNSQCLGWAIGEDEIFIDIERMDDFANVTSYYYARYHYPIMQSHAGPGRHVRRDQAHRYRRL